MSDQRNDVVELMVRYGAAIDDKDWNLFERCFTSDVVALYEGFHESHGYSDLEAWVRGSVTTLDVTQHLLSNFLVQLEETSATFQCYVQATHIRRGASNGPRFTIGGPYANHAVLTDDGWRMDRFRFRATWTDGNPEVLGHLAMEGIPL